MGYKSKEQEDSVEKRGQVTCQVDYLDAKIEHIENTFERLEDSLQNILSKDAKDVGSPSENEERVPLAQDINGCVLRLIVVNERLNSIIDRLEN